MSSASMSPPGPSFSTVPPPPKRHQVGPPGQPDAVNTAPPPRPAPQGVPPGPSQSGISGPQYSFYQNPGPSYAVPYHQSPKYSTTPVPAPSTTPNGPPRSSHGPAERTHYGHIGGPPSPPLSRSVHNSTPGPAPPVSSSQPRQMSSSYDTRPPPTTTSSGFASINMPQASSGFAPINARATATPPVPHANLAKPIEPDTTKTPSHPQIIDHGLDGARYHGYGTTPTTNATTAPSSTSSKRTPSTTHPYQMSEAFANRHHHCERVDSLNRGIWTSHGPGGTQENPTGPPVEMYLRCDHDGCRRIDWRTVHGLQCHIVKNHEQPKGTIGSLEKALDRYGVPVREVEDYERQHGRGTAGTVADPKNHKIKTKTKEALVNHKAGVLRRNTPTSYGIDPSARPAGYKPSPTTTRENSTRPDSVKRSPSASTATAGFVQDDIVYSDEEEVKEAKEATKTAPLLASRPVNRFEAIRTDWHSTVGSIETPSKPETAGNKVPRDADMTHTSPSAVPAPTTSPAAGDSHYIGSVVPDRRPAVSMTPPLSDLSRTVSIPDPSKIASNDSVPAWNGTPSMMPDSTSLLQARTQLIHDPVRPMEAHQVKEEGGPAAIPTPPAQPSEDTDTQMSGVADEGPKVEKSVDGVVNGDAKNDESAVDPTRQGSGPPPTALEGKEDGEKNNDQVKEAVAAAPNGRGPNMPSPLMTTKSLEASGTFKRMSRRSSAARKGLTEMDVEFARDGDRPKEKEDGGDDDGDSITVASNTTTTRDRNKEENLKDRERETARTPPRRTANTRLLRKGRA